MKEISRVEPFTNYGVAKRFIKKKTYKTKKNYKVNITWFRIFIFTVIKEIIIIYGLR